MTIVGLTVVVVALGLPIGFLAMLMQFLAGLDRVKSLWHQRIPASRASLA
jgi:hypothetical protein